MTAVDAGVVGRTMLGESTVFGVLGPRRRGKSLLANYLCGEVAKAGGRVLHRGNLSFGEVLDVHWLLDQNPAELGNVLVYLDEIQSLLDSRRSASIFATLISHNLIQSGHLGMSIIWTTQFERRVSRDLIDQTDWVFYVLGARRPWPTAEQIAGGDDWRCAGFDRKNRHVFAHEECPKYDHQRLVAAKLVAQHGALMRPGWSKNLELHCAQRFYQLGDTKFLIDSKQAVLRMGAEAMRRREIARQSELLRELVVELGRNREHMSAMDIGRYMAGTHDIEWDPAYVGKQLRAIGVPTTRKDGVRGFSIGAYADAEPEDVAIA
jgi:hypothetical protein